MKVVSRFQPITMHRFGVARKPNLNKMTPGASIAVSEGMIEQRIAAPTPEPMEEPTQESIPEHVQETKPNIQMIISEEECVYETPPKSATPKPESPHIDELHTFYIAPAEEFKHEEEEIHIRPSLFKSKSLELSFFKPRRKI